MRTSPVTVLIALGLGCSSEVASGGGSGGFGGTDGEQASAASGTFTVMASTAASGGSSSASGGGGADSTGSGGAEGPGGSDVGGAGGSAAGGGGATCTPMPDLQTDPVNCGTCGHDCLGGSCVAGECQPVQLYDGQLDYGLAVDDTFVYFQELDVPGPTCADDALGRIPKGGGTVEFVDITGTISDPLVARGGYVYYYASPPGDPANWCGSWTGEYRRVATTSATPETLLSCPTDTSCDVPSQFFTVDASTFYFLNGVSEGIHTVNTMPLSGGSPVEIAQLDSGTELAGWSDIMTNDTSLYWLYYTNSVEDTILEVPVSGGTPATVITASAAGMPRLLAGGVDSTYIFYIAWDEAADICELQQLTIGSTTSPTVLYHSDPCYMDSVALSGSDVCFIGQVYGGGSVICVPKTGGTPRTLVKTTSILELVADDTAVYYVSVISSYPVDDWVINRLAK